MSNQQPLNMLSKQTNESRQQALQVTASGEDGCQVALANLFSSLSNLASNQANIQRSPSVSNIPNVNNPAVTNSLQSVMAAAMAQQQQNHLHHQHQQHQKQQQQLLTSVAGSHLSPSSQSTSTKSFLGADQVTADFFNQSFDPSVQYCNQQVQSAQQPQQRINYCTICNKELCNKYFMKTHMLKMHGINLEMEQSDTNDDGDELEDTEECSNQNDESGDNNQQSTDLSWPAGKKSGDSSFGDKKTCQSAKTSSPSSSSSSKKPASNGNKLATSVINGFAGNSMGGVVCDICNKELCSKYFLKVHKQNTHGIMTDYQDASQFVYPFPGSIVAPNPFMPTLIPPNLGPPPPPPQANNLNFFNVAGNNTSDNETIQANEEQSRKVSLSKKQRSSQNKLNQQNAIPSNTNIEQTNEMQANVALGTNSKLESVYRLILAQQQQQHQSLQPGAPVQPLMSLNTIPTNPMGALMCFSAMNSAGPFGHGAGLSPAMIVDNILRNQHLFNRNQANGTKVHPPIKSVSDKNNNNSNSNSNNNNNSNNDSKSNRSKSAKDSSNSNRYFSHYTEACPMCDRRFKSIKWLKTHMMNDHKQEIGAYMQMMMQYIYASKSQMAAATMASFEQQNLLAHQQRQQNLSEVAQLPNHLQQTSILDKCMNWNFYQQQTQLQQTQPIQLGSQQLNLNQPNFLDNSDKQRCMINWNQQLQHRSSPDDSNNNQNDDAQDFTIDTHRRQNNSSSSDSLGQSSPTSNIETRNLSDNSFNQDLDIRLNFELLHNKNDTFIVSNAKSSRDCMDFVENDSNESHSSRIDERNIEQGTNNLGDEKSQARLQIKTESN